ncbi:DUF2155 domain-containing protein [Kozakia baliensis]|uniref:DUF2155 domain-containing protein n=1 Tax=Kozakia baliensis TaxID=153496 RepID=UPI00087AC051|nr:DUF2155 domain-containing protein [Kozakia baliensis]AOX20698.1 hypothetical protein A0U90_10850 [Kozakia baliensis]
MKRSLLLLLALAAPVARGAEMVAPPVMYAPNLWQGRQQAVVRVLDRIDSHVSTLTIPADGAGDYKTLHIAVHRCVDRPPTLASDAAMQVSITDNGNPDLKFDGWVMAREPSLATFRSALYNVSIVSCGGDAVAPNLAPLPQPAAPVVVSSTPSGAQDQPGDVNDNGPSAPAPGSGPMQLAPPADEGAAPAARPASPAAPPSEESGPMQLTPPSDEPPVVQGPQGEHLPPPQPYSNRP